MRVRVLIIVVSLLLCASALLLGLRLTRPPEVRLPALSFAVPAQALASVQPRYGHQHPPTSPALGNREDSSDLDFDLREDTETPDAFELYPWSSGLGEQFSRGLVISGATPHRLILFTFDDGPERRTTPHLLDELDRLGIRAVFFITAARIRGDNARQRQQAAIAREIVRRGHTVASHTVNHKQLPLLEDNAIELELTEGEAIFERVFGNRPWLLRPPGGARSHRTDALIEARGYTLMLWNLGAGDVHVRSAQEVFDTWKRVLDRREQEEGNRGGIILLHDTYEWSVEALPLIVEELRRRNCALLERGEELYDILDHPGMFFAPRAEPSGKDAPPARPSRALLEARQQQVRTHARRRCEAM